MVRVKWFGGSLEKLIVLSSSVDGYHYWVEKAPERFRVVASKDGIIIWSLEFQRVLGLKGSEEAAMDVSLKVKGVSGRYVFARVNVNVSNFSVLDEASAQQFIRVFDGFMRVFHDKYVTLYVKFENVRGKPVYDEYLYLNIISDTKIYLKYAFTLGGVGAGMELVKDGFLITSYYFLRTESLGEIEDELDALMISESGSKFSSVTSGGKK